MVVFQSAGTASSTNTLLDFGEGTTNVDVEWGVYGCDSATVTVRKRKLVNTSGWITTSNITTKATWVKWPGIEAAADAWEDIEAVTSDICTSDSAWTINYTSSSSGTWAKCYRYSDAGVILPTLEDKLSEMIRKRQAPQVIVPSHKSLPSQADIREVRARETLRRVLGEDKYRLYLKKGFVAVTAKSGLVYQIDSGHMTKVWDCGTLVEKLCIYLKGDFPPTDSVIVKYLLVLNNEDQYRSLANKSAAVQPAPRQPLIEVAQPSLVELFNDLKKSHTRRRRKAAA